ncbi:hypothetical protein BLA39750_00945 [Burkholderia lata]|uniref:Uncharacterized protein n=1 Tax=Burkholderia lata (strain ATCC 17760 / DSM 23089 / LMG 22485 / NCIMB 9086 / R18194 / 383) TaxID=482957 RepID=A0A6P2VCX6_BURL3|nr:hypothetical protein BLA39750_00945 [Burkholderia lata]
MQAKQNAVNHAARLPNGDCEIFDDVDGRSNVCFPLNAIAPQLAMPITQRKLHMPAATRHPDNTAIRPEMLAATVLPSERAVA